MDYRRSPMQAQSRQKQSLTDSQLVPVRPRDAENPNVPIVSAKKANGDYDMKEIRHLYRIMVQDDPKHWIAEGEESLAHAAA